MNLDIYNFKSTRSYTWVRFTNGNITHLEVSLFVAQFGCLHDDVYSRPTALKLCMQDMPRGRKQSFDAIGQLQ